MLPLGSYRSDFSNGDSIEGEAAESLSRRGRARLGCRKSPPPLAHEPGAGAKCAERGGGGQAKVGRWSWS